MDISFMEEYYRSKYEDPVGEICENDTEFYKIRHRAYQDIETLEKRLQKFGEEVKNQSADELEGWLRSISEELTKLLNKTLDDLSEKYAYLIEKSYLQGAFDREKMLR